MTVQYVQPDFTLQDAASYKANIDQATASLHQYAGEFLAHESAIVNMTVRIEAGKLVSSGGFIAQVAQSTTSLVAPVTFPRIDRIAIDVLTGGFVIIAGVEAASPVAPDYTDDQYPLAQVLLQTTTTTITNAMITDERPLIQAVGGGLSNVGGAGQYDIAFFNAPDEIDGSTDFTYDGTTVTINPGDLVIENNSFREGFNLYQSGSGQAGHIYSDVNRGPSAMWTFQQDNVAAQGRAVEILNNGVDDSLYVQGPTNVQGFMNIETISAREAFYVGQYHAGQAAYIYSDQNDALPTLTLDRDNVSATGPVLQILNSGAGHAIHAAGLSKLSDNGTDGQLWIENLDAGAEEKLWEIKASAGGEFTLRSVLDAGGGFAQQAFAFQRTGTNITTSSIFSGTLTTIHSDTEVRLASPLTKATGYLEVNNFSPTIALYEGNGAVDNRRWDTNVDAEQFSMRMVNDAITLATKWLTVDRTANIADLVTILAPFTTTGNITINKAAPFLDLPANFGNMASIRLAGNAGVLGTTSFDIQHDGVRDAYLWNHAPGNMFFGTSGTLALTINAAGAATFAGNVLLSNASSPELTLTDTTNSCSARMVATNTDARIGTTSSHSLAIHTGGTTAMTISTTQNVTFAGALLTSASTTIRAGFNIPEGVAPTTPNDGDFWITAAGAANMRLNGVTVNLAGGGGGGIGGSIAEHQIAIGAATADEIEGSAEFTYENVANIQQIFKFGANDIRPKYMWAGSNTGYLQINGGNGGFNGGNLILYGGAHATNANDIAMGAAGDQIFRYDDSENMFTHETPVTFNGDVDKAPINLETLSAIGPETPSAPVDGDMWLQRGGLEGLYIHIDGTTYGPIT